MNQTEKLVPSEILKKHMVKRMIEDGDTEEQASAFYDKIYLGDSGQKRVHDTVIEAMEEYARQYNLSSTHLSTKKAGLITKEDAEQLALKNWAQGVKDGLASKGFISLQDALRFGMWASSRIKAVLNDSLCVTHDNKTYNHSQLFQIYQDDK